MISIHPVNMIIILAVILAGVLVRAAFVARRHKREKAALDTGDAVRGHDEVEALRQRVAVLERITIEKENALEREFELLRDK